MMARLIAEKFAAIKQAQPEVLHGEEDPVDEVVALPTSTTAAAADHSQLSSKLYFVGLAHSTRNCQHCCTVTAVSFASPAAFRQPDSLAAIRQLSQLSSAANCQLACSLSAVAAHCHLRCTQPASNQSVQLHIFRNPPICQPSFDLSAQLQSDICTSNWRLGSVSALAVAGQLSCNLSVWLPRSQSTSNCQLRCTPFSPAAVFQLVCNQLARLQSVSTAAQ